MLAVNTVHTMSWISVLVTLVTSQSTICIWNSKNEFWDHLNGEYIKQSGQSQSHSYWKQSTTSCGGQYTQHYIFANYFAADDLYYWTIHFSLSPDDAIEDYVECGNDWNPVPSNPTQCQNGWQEWTSDTEFIEQPITATAGPCPILSCDRIEVANSGVPQCDDIFIKDVNQNNVYSNNDGVYWYFNRYSFKWYCSQTLNNDDCSDENTMSYQYLNAKNDNWKGMNLGESFTLTMSNDNMATFYCLGPSTMSPSKNPSKNPTLRPTFAPTRNPTLRPTQYPSSTPTTRPSEAPVGIGDPTKDPSPPSPRPTISPTTEPTVYPTKEPTDIPTVTPTTEPTTEPTNIPTTFITTEIPTKKHKKSKTTRNALGTSSDDGLDDLSLSIIYTVVGWVMLCIMCMMYIYTRRRCIKNQEEQFLIGSKSSHVAPAAKNLSKPRDIVLVQSDSEYKSGGVSADFSINEGTEALSDDEQKVKEIKVPPYAKLDSNISYNSGVITPYTHGKHEPSITRFPSIN